jgi:hypothetical protein
VYLVGSAILENCRSKNAGGVALNNSVLFMGDFAKMTSCRARENGGGIMTFGECEIRMSGQVVDVIVYSYGFRTFHPNACMNASTCSGVCIRPYISEESVNVLNV